MNKLSIAVPLVAAGALLAAHASHAVAAEYHVSNSGDDRDRGTRPASAWKTLSKVNGFAFSPGDIVRFEKGGVWRGQLVPRSGSTEGHVTYTSYGTGEKPLLLGSVEKNDPGDWHGAGAGIWSAGPFQQDVGNIIFNDGKLCGIKVWNESDLVRPNAFWYDAKNKAVKLRCPRNPATVYRDIECALKKHIINQGGRSYVIYDGLHLAYGAAHGIGGGGTHHIVVRNCDLCFIGGGHQLTRQTQKGPRHVRYGNGVEFWAGAHDNLVENCRIWDIYDAGLTNQGSGKNAQYNIRYRNNTIWNCEYSFEYWNRPESSTTHDIYFDRNICFHAGRGWSHSQRPWPAGVHLMFFSNTARTRGFYIRNNIFHRAEHSAMNLPVDHWNGLDKLVLEGNVYYQPPEKVLIRWGRKSYASREFDTYRSETGKDRNSKSVTLGGIRLEPVKITLGIHDSGRIRASARYSQSVTLDVTRFAAFSSSDPTVAAVGPAGLVKGVRGGKAVITAAFEGATATASVTVGP